MTIWCNKCVFDGTVMAAGFLGSNLTIRLQHGFDSSGSNMEITEFSLNPSWNIRRSHVCCKHVPFIEIPYLPMIDGVVLLFEQSKDPIRIVDDDAVKLRMKTGINRENEHYREILGEISKLGKYATIQGFYPQRVVFVDDDQPCLPMPRCFQGEEITFRDCDTVQTLAVLSGTIMDGENDDFESTRTLRFINGINGATDPTANAKELEHKGPFLGPKMMRFRQKQMAIKLRKGDANCTEKVVVMIKVCAMCGLQKHAKSHLWDNVQCRVKGCCETEEHDKTTFCSMDCYCQAHSMTMAMALLMTKMHGGSADGDSELKKDNDYIVDAMNEQWNNTFGPDGATTTSDSRVVSNDTAGSLSSGVGAQSMLLPVDGLPVVHGCDKSRLGLMTRMSIDGCDPVYDKGVMFSIHEIILVLSKRQDNESLVAAISIAKRAKRTMFDPEDSPTEEFTWERKARGIGSDDVRTTEIWFDKQIKDISDSIGDKRIRTDGEGYSDWYRGNKEMNDRYMAPRLEELSSDASATSLTGGLHNTANVFPTLKSLDPRRIGTYGKPMAAALTEDEFDKPQDPIVYSDEIESQYGTPEVIETLYGPEILSDKARTAKPRSHRLAQELYKSRRKGEKYLSYMSQCHREGFTKGTLVMRFLNQAELMEHLHNQRITLEQIFCVTSKRVTEDKEVISKRIQNVLRNPIYAKNRDSGAWMPMDVMNDVHKVSSYEILRLFMDEPATIEVLFAEMTEGARQDIVPGDTQTHRRVQTVTAVRAIGCIPCGWKTAEGPIPLDKTIVVPHRVWIEISPFQREKIGELCHLSHESFRPRIFRTSIWSGGLDENLKRVTEGKCINVMRTSFHKTAQRRINEMTGVMYARAAHKQPMYFRSWMMGKMDYYVIDEEGISRVSLEEINSKHVMQRDTSIMLFRNSGGFVVIWTETGALDWRFIRTVEIRNQWTDGTPWVLYHKTLMAFPTAMVIPTTEKEDFCDLSAVYSLTSLRNWRYVRGSSDWWVPEEKLQDVMGAELLFSKHYSGIEKIRVLQKRTDKESHFPTFKTVKTQYRCAVCQTSMEGQLDLVIVRTGPMLDVSLPAGIVTHERCATAIGYDPTKIADFDRLNHQCAIDQRKREVDLTLRRNWLGPSRRLVLAKAMEELNATKKGLTLSHSRLLYDHIVDSTIEGVKEISTIKLEKDAVMSYRLNNGLFVPIDQVMCEMCQLPTVSGSTKCPTIDCPTKPKFKYYDEDGIPAPIGTLFKRCNAPCFSVRFYRMTLPNEPLNSRFQESTRNFGRSWRHYQGTAVEISEPSWRENWKIPVPTLGEAWLVNPSFAQVSNSRNDQIHTESADSSEAETSEKKLPHSRQVARNCYNRKSAMVKMLQDITGKSEVALIRGKRIPTIRVLPDNGESKQGRGLLWLMSTALSVEDICFTHWQRPINKEAEEMEVCLTQIWKLVQGVGYGDPQYKQTTNHGADVGIAQENAINGARIYLLQTPRVWGIPNPFMGKPEAVKRFLDTLIAADKRRGTLIRFVASAGCDSDMADSWKQEDVVDRMRFIFDCSMIQGTLVKPLIDSEHIAMSDPKQPVCLMLPVIFKIQKLLAKQAKVELDDVLQRMWKYGRTSTPVVQIASRQGQVLHEAVSNEESAVIDTYDRWHSEVCPLDTSSKNPMAVRNLWFYPTRAQKRAIMRAMTVINAWEKERRSVPVKDYVMPRTMGTTIMQVVQTGVRLRNDGGDELAHIRIPIPMVGLCAENLWSTCKNRNCHLRHDKRYNRLPNGYKTGKDSLVCPFFVLNGSCRFGSTCNRLHVHTGDLLLKIEDFHILLSQKEVFDEYHVQLYQLRVICQKVCPIDWARTIARCCWPVMAYEIQRGKDSAEMSWRSVESVTEKLLEETDPLNDVEYIVRGYKLKLLNIARGVRAVDQRRENLARMLCRDCTKWGCISLRHLNYGDKNYLEIVTNESINEAIRFKWIYEGHDPDGDMVLPNLIYRTLTKDIKGQALTWPLVNIPQEEEEYIPTTEMLTRFFVMMQLIFTSELHVRMYVVSDESAKECKYVRVIGVDVQRGIMRLDKKDMEMLPKSILARLTDRDIDAQQFGKGLTWIRSHAEVSIKRWATCKRLWSRRMAAVVAAVNLVLGVTEQREKVNAHIIDLVAVNNIVRTSRNCKDIIPHWDFEVWQGDPFAWEAGGLCPIPAAKINHIANEQMRQIKVAFPGKYDDDDWHRTVIAQMAATTATLAQSAAKATPRFIMRRLQTQGDKRVKDYDLASHGFTDSIGCLDASSRNTCRLLREECDVVFTDDLTRISLRPPGQTKKKTKLVPAARVIKSEFGDDDDLRDPVDDPGDGSHGAKDDSDGNASNRREQPFGGESGVQRRAWLVSADKSVGKSAPVSLVPNEDGDHGKSSGSARSVTFKACSFFNGHIGSQKAAFSFKARCRHGHHCELVHDRAVEIQYPWLTACESWVRVGNCPIIRDGECCPFDHELILQGAGWKADRFKYASAHDPVVDDLVIQWDVPWEQQPQRFEIEEERKQALAYAYRHGIERLVVRADVWKNTYGGTYSYPEWRGKKSFSIGDIRHACARTEIDVHELRDVDISALEKAEDTRPPLPRRVSYNPSMSRPASSSQRSAPRSYNRSGGEQWQYGDYDERRSNDSWFGQSSSGSGYHHEEVDYRSRGSGYRHKDYDEHRRSKDHDYKRHKDYDRRDNQRR